jgi:hypothetical protein
VFGNEQLTAALVDRLTHRATILEFIGESYRFRERLQRQQTAGGAMEAGMAEELSGAAQEPAPAPDGDNKQPDEGADAAATCAAGSRAAPPRKPG